MKPTKKQAKAKLAPTAPELFDRVAAILEKGRANVVRAVNSQMVLTYWLIGREIVHEIQGGEDRAAYGQQVMRELSKQLSQRYGRGFSLTNLQYFRQFFTVYQNRVPELTPIHHIGCGESDPMEKGHIKSAQSKKTPIRHIGGGESDKPTIQHIRSGVLAGLTEAVEQLDEKEGVLK